MRQSVYLLVASQILGCIPIGSELMDSNGEPSMEPGTEVVIDSGDTEENQGYDEDELNEALQLDLDGMPVDDFGTLGMKDWHLIFDGELALTYEMEPQGNEFNRFLQSDTPWGFAVNIAPYNDDSASFLFGNETDEAAQFVLFQTDSVVLSMKFERLNTGGEFTGGVLPSIQYTIRDPQSKQVCHQQEWTKNGDGFVTNQEYLNDGFQMIMTHGVSIDDSLDGATLYLRDAEQNIYTVFSYANEDIPLSCPEDLNENIEKIVFGQGTYLYVDDDVEFYHHLRGRVDDLLLFSVKQGDFTFETQNANLWLLSNSIGLPQPQTYSVYDFLPDDNSDDGFGWFNFQRNNPNQNPNEFLDASNQFINSTNNPVFGDICRLDDSNSRDCTTDDDLQWVQDHYRTDGNLTFADGMWMGDESNGSVFEENENFMSASHIKFDGSIFLQHIPNLQSRSTEDGGIASTVPFLDMDTPWGFAFLWAPDSRDTSMDMFGDGSNSSTGVETTLFHVGNNLLTIRFVNVLGAQQHKVYPVLTFMTEGMVQGTNTICRRIELTPDSTTFNGMRVDQLEQGMRLMAVFEEAGIAGSFTYSLNFQINGVSVFDDSVDLTSVLNGVDIANCMQSSDTPDFVNFGSNVTIDGNTFRGVKGRIDDLIVIDASHNTFDPIFDDFANASSIGELNASSFPNMRDNLLWWSFDMDEDDPTVLREASTITNSDIEPDRFQFRMKVGNGSPSGSTIADENAGMYFITPQPE